MEDAYNLFLPKSRFSSFYLTFCGKSKCAPNHFFGPHVRENYILHYITSGKGLYRIGKREYTLEAGQCFLIEPNVLTYYQADSENPWSYVWIAFSGSKAKDFILDIGLGDGKVIFNTSYGNEIEQIVTDMLKKSEEGVLNDYNSEAHLFSLFDYLKRERIFSNTQKSDYENSYIQSAISFIKENYMNQITVQDVAKCVNINRSYLFNLFKKERNCSPQEYLTRYRIAKAKELLAQTDYTIETVCYSCGYSSAVTFSRAFKKVVDQTPSQFRQFERNFHKEQYAKVRNQIKEPE
ncbi:MAG: AraC family transcriptional regulator [Firmicutes bacterium]|nr:AraC family transcriptional regulator [Bacillota bacterium]